MSALRHRYLKTLGLDKAKAEQLGKALNRAYELRTFEIEHYWKRATYFWGFQIAIFAAFGLKDFSGANLNPVAVALSGLGILTAVANYLSARGSKFWQKNWERHIDMLEDDIEGRLHKTIWLSNGKAEFSVSRVNEYLSLFFILFWIGITFYVASKFVGWPSLHFLRDIPAWCQLLVIAAMIVPGAAFLYGQKTRLPGSWPKEDGSHGNPFNQCSCWHNRSTESHQFIRRYAPDEPGKGEDTKAA